jgi:LPS export ABC transporter protein LptC
MLYKKLIQCFSFLLLLLIIVSCSENKATPTKKVNNSSDIENADLVSWNIDVLFIDSSYTKAILKAKRARIYNERMETLLDSGLVLDFFSKITNKRISNLIADSAKIDDKTKDMIAKGNVIVVADSSQTKLETSLLLWNNKTQKLYSTEFVKITSPGQNLQGYGFESDLNLDHYKIFKVSGDQK